MLTWRPFGSVRAGCRTRRIGRDVRWRPRAGLHGCNCEKFDATATPCRGTHLQLRGAPGLVEAPLVPDVNCGGAKRGG